MKLLSFIPHRLFQLRCLIILLMSGILLSIMILQPFFVQNSAAVSKHNSSAMPKERPTISSEAAILIDAKSGDVLFDKNARKKMYPASITKIITGIIAIEDGDLDDIVSVSEKARSVVGTRVYLEMGEEVPLLKLVQGLLISSGNDAGTAIAEYLDGSEEAFAERMNRFIREKIGVKDTHFTNPHGLFDENHYTTAYDMSQITKYAMNNDVFREVVGTNSMEWVGEAWQTTIYNHNRLIRQYEGATGVKNGYVHRSGHTLVGSAERDGMELIAVTLNGNSADLAYRDMKQLLDYGFNYYQTLHIEEGEIFSVEGHDYHVPEDVFITIDRDDSPKINVSWPGVLTIESSSGSKLYRTKLQGGELISLKQSYPSFYVQSNVVLDSELSYSVMSSGLLGMEVQSSNSQQSYLLGGAVILGSMIAVAAIIWYRKRRRRARMFNE